MEEVEFPSTSVFLGYEYVQRAGSEWRGEHCTLNHSYLIPEIHDLSEA